MTSQLKFRVLLVDDNKQFVKAFKYLILAMFEHQIAVIDDACDGATAIAMVEANPNYDIIFLDVDMPNKNGFEVAKHINFNFPLIKIIAVSWHQELEVFTKMFSAGASNFIVKSNLNETSLVNAFKAIKGFRVESV